MDDGIWRWVWRFNALAIAGVAVVGGLLALFALYHVVKDLTGQKYVPNLVNVDPEAQAETSLRINAFSPLGRAGLLWAPIERATVTPLRVSSKYAAATVDYLIYEPETGRARRLLELPDSMIVEARLLYAPEDDRNERPARAMLVVYVDADSNGDARLNHEDRRRLALARPDGTGLAPLAVTDRMLGVNTLSETEAVAMIETGGAIEALHLDLAARAVARRTSVTP